MGCCSLKEKKENMSRIEHLFRLSFYVMLHKSFLAISAILSWFNKDYKSIHRFHKSSYKKTLEELR